MIEYNHSYNKITFVFQVFNYLAYAFKNKRPLPNVSVFHFILLCYILTIITIMNSFIKHIFIERLDLLGGKERHHQIYSSPKSQLATYTTLKVRVFYTTVLLITANRTVISCSNLYIISRDIFIMRRKRRTPQGPELWDGGAGNIFPCEYYIYKMY